MRTTLRAGVLSVVMAISTIVVGWWAVPIVAAIYGVNSRGQAGSGRTAALAAVLAWGVFLAWDIIGPAEAQAGLIGEAMGLPAFGLPVLTLVFPALLAWSAAHLAGALVSLRTSLR
jgi:hypothetical protein